MSAGRRPVVEGHPPLPVVLAAPDRLQQAEADFEPLPFDSDAARAFGQVAASLRRAGRKTSARAYDAMIAAIAIANEAGPASMPSELRSLAKPNGAAGRRLI